MTKLIATHVPLPGARQFMWAVLESGHNFAAELDSDLNVMLVSTLEKNREWFTSLVLAHAHRFGTILCYDNGGETMDRYSVVFMAYPERGDLYQCLGMNSEPFHGIGQMCAATPGTHLGRRIGFDELPEQCRKAVLMHLILRWSVQPSQAKP